MTLWVVADSGVFLATALEEDLSEHADALIDYWTEQDYQVAAPYLFRYEIVSTMRKHVARGNVTLADGKRLLKLLLDRPVQPFADEALLERAFDIATQFGRPVAYASTYLALAERLNCEFWTADKRLINIVGSTLNWVKWIGDFPLPEPSEDK